jgi:hypothetical protein
MADAQIEHASHDIVRIFIRGGHEWAEAHEGRDRVGARVRTLRGRPRQVPLGQDADQPAGFDHRQRADVRKSHPARRLTQRLGEVSGHDLLPGQLTNSHVAQLLSLKSMRCRSPVGWVTPG